jgi:hypothetical protein
VTRSRFWRWVGGCRAMNESWMRAWAEAIRPAPLVLGFIGTLPSGRPLHPF